MPDAAELVISTMSAFIPFFRQTVKAFHTTGAIAPSSIALARALAAPLEQRGDAPVELLEAGPGTGALTIGILPHLREGDRLTLCEINGDFCDHLEKMFRHSKPYADYRERVTIHHGAVEELPAERRFAHVVCGIPFNNFPPSLVEQIFSSLRNRLETGGTLNFFEYAAIRSLKRPFVSAAERARLDAVEAIISALVVGHQVQAQLVMGNFPPAWARSLRFASDPPSLK